MKKSLIIIAGSLVVIGVVVYGSISLYSKLNKVNELNQRLEETMDTADRKDSTEGADQSLSQENEKVGTEQTQESEPTLSQEQESTTMPEAEAQPTPVATLIPVQTLDNVDKSQKPADNAKSTEDKALKKHEIDAAITADLQQLKTSCQASSSSLVQQITQELGKNDEAALETIQSKYLTKIYAAEAECDAQFNQLISNAKSEYGAADLNDQPLPDWSSQYESAKAQARADAIVAIANTVQ